MHAYTGSINPVNLCDVLHEHRNCAIGIIINEVVTVFKIDSYHMVVAFYSMLAIKKYYLDC